MSSLSVPVRSICTVRLGWPPAWVVDGVTLKSVMSNALAGAAHAQQHERREQQDRAGPPKTRTATRNPFKPSLSTAYASYCWPSTYPPSRFGLHQSFVKKACGSYEDPAGAS